MQEIWMSAKLIFWLFQEDLTNDAIIFSEILLESSSKLLTIVFHRRSWYIAMVLQGSKPVAARNTEELSKRNYFLTFLVALSGPQNYTFRNSLMLNQDNFPGKFFTLLWTHASHLFYRENADVISLYKWKKFRLSFNRAGICRSKLQFYR